MKNLFNLLRLQPLVFLKIANMSSLYNPILLELYLLPVKLNIKMPENSHTSGLSWDPIVTSKLFIYNIYMYKYIYIYIYILYIYIYIYIHYVYFTVNYYPLRPFFTTMKRLITKWYIPSIQKSKTLKIKPTLIFWIR